MLLLVSGIGLGCLMQLIVIIYRDFRHLLVGRVFLLALFVSGTYLVHPIVPSPYRWMTSILQTAVPGVFWLICQLVFAHRPKLKTLWGAMALYSFAAPALGRLFREFRSLTPIETFALWDLAQYFEYVVVLHGLYFVISHWRDDLVKSRRTARLIFLMVFGGAVGGAALSLNLGIYHELTPGLITSVASLVILACVVQAREGIFSLVGENAAINNVGSATTSDPEASTQAESAEVWLEMQALEELMQSGFYKTEKLTLKKLAGEVGIPEYRLRSLINQRLGYRNFNDYINQLRIAEASRRLSQDADIPILNVSLDVGFRSLSSFNRAFKDIVHCTPTEFRQRYFKAAQTDQKL